MDDAKDWTWVLDEVCGECNYHADALDRDDLAGRVRAVGGAWRQLLGRGAIVTEAPTGERTWTILEYGCHVRDVFQLFEKRLRLMLKKRKTPTFKDWDQEQAALDGDYPNQDPARVAWDLATAAGQFADLLDRVNGDEWNKRGIRSDGAEFTVESFARYLLHDVEHHLWDARQLVAAATA